MQKRENHGVKLVGDRQYGASQGYDQDAGREKVGRFEIYMLYLQIYARPIIKASGDEMWSVYAQALFCFIDRTAAQK